MDLKLNVGLFQALGPLTDSLGSELFVTNPAARVALPMGTSMCFQQAVQYIMIISNMILRGVVATISRISKISKISKKSESQKVIGATYISDVGFITSTRILL